MSGHGHWRDRLADLATERLSSPERLELMEHLEQCSECADLASFHAELHDAFAVAHPDPSALRRLAQGPIDPDAPLARHVRSCTSCEIELESWRRGLASPEPTARTRRFAGWRGLAAGVLVGIGLAAGFASLRPDPEALPAAAARVHHLEVPRRSHTTVVRIQSVGEPLLIGVPVPIADVTEGARFDVEIVADQAVVWSTPVGRGLLLEAHRHGGPLVVIVPPERLRPGRHSLRLVRRIGVDASVLLEIPFESVPNVDDP